LPAFENHAQVVALGCATCSTLVSYTMTDGATALLTASQSGRVPFVELLLGAANIHVNHAAVEG
jgi:hypothetical protein